MKKFLIYAALFIVPILGFNFVSNVLMAPNAWTFRSWEGALVYNNLLPCSIGKLYPNLSISKYESGDLAHHSKFAINRYLEWKTDRYGFRNETVEPDGPIDIVVIGDSFIAGQDLDQSQTFSNILGKLTGKKVYQMAPVKFQLFRDLVEMRKITKPKIVIFSAVERYINEMPTLPPNASIKEKFRNSVADIALLNKFSVVLDKMFKNASLKSIRARTYGLQGKGLQSPIDSTMFFYQGKNKTLDYDEPTFKLVLNILQEYKAYCDASNIRFIFMPCPDKETVYYNLVPFTSRPKLLEKLYAKLTAAGIPFVNILEIYDHNAVTGKYFYYPDDTHWNPYGVETVAKATAKMLYGKI